MYASLDGGSTKSWMAGSPAAVVAGRLARPLPSPVQRARAVAMSRVAWSREAAQRAPASRGSSRVPPPGGLSRSWVGGLEGIVPRTSDRARRPQKKCLTAPNRRRLCRPAQGAQGVGSELAPVIGKISDPSNDAFGFEDQGVA